MPPKKKNQTVIHEFACEIFPRKLWIVKKPPHGYLEKHFQTAGGEKLHEYDVDDAKAVTYKEIYNIDTDKLGILIVLLENNITVSDCAHEATHFAMEMYAAIGEEVSTEHQEVMAYLVGYATDCIYQVVTNKFRPMFDGSREIS
ncbi:hypothetical protein EEL34_15240 [Muribaculaceae bacterium Isolate-039 (Harlan)]|uniref:hypothetical protein n=1 Tax=Muribaculum sp. TaxID=1918611 RepID=UPI000F4A0F7C|nr:hypothetical protein [Muribaculum sp.]MCX4279270.1 hypothetical protein [Muribaculum sp.]ROS79935.1 hypothetical protein EEL34_15240 [Muribaculaceae bacterium Isolate-039 (Harlan)]ROS92382.1 hypothetical protein EEL36_09160 [Muribaculaceae bacterium Isolate-043 (Harlan)]